MINRLLAVLGDAGQGILGEPGASVEVLYLGSDALRVTSHEGVLWTH